MMKGNPIVVDEASSMQLHHLGGGSLDGSPSDTASSISSPSASDTTPPLNLKQTHAHQTSIHANPTASYGFYSPGFDASLLGDMDNQQYYIAGNGMLLQYPASQYGSKIQSDVPPKGYFALTKFPAYNQGKGGLLYPDNPINLKSNAKKWDGNEKWKTRSKVTGTTDINLLNANHGTGKGNTTGSLGTDGNGNLNSITSPIRKDQYNLPDFATRYDHAFFFVIKSYSEDDIHKSIKYNVWASTSNGNKRLDTAYKDAQKWVLEKGSNCPVFLFFSVNASGQFCGVAEMTGGVDFTKNMNFWQQDKWNGYFPVKWHIIKDVPNQQLRHIILENNENKPVTNSRDTQEVKFHQGIEMLSILKNYVSNTSILDDFDFYESRQKVIQEKRIRHSTLHCNLQKVDELTSSFQSVHISTLKSEEQYGNLG